MRTLAKTVLFTDMEASTEFTLDHGDAPAMALMRIHETVVRAAVEGCGGGVVKNTGDGFLAVFPTSDAGVRAALEIRAHLDAHNTQRPDSPLRVRLGLHSGDVIEDMGDVFGLAVSAAARVTSKARTGQVLVSDRVRVEASDGGWTYVDRGSFWLKGLREQWRLYEVVPDGERSTAAPALGYSLPFVGRDAERARLRLAVDDANSGAGGLVFVSGPAGSGKSRLAEEVGVECAERGMHFVVGRCTDTTQLDPYAVLVEVAEAIERRMTAPAFRALLGPAAGEMARLLPHLRQRYPDLEPPAELGSFETSRYFFASVKDVLARLAALRPLVLLLDDLQWADAPTLRFVEHLAGDLGGVPILVIGTYTTEAVSNGTPLHATLARLHQRRTFTSIALDPLHPEEITQLLTLIAGSPPPEALVSTVNGAAEGNAFFTTELVRHLLDRGDVLDEHGWRDDLAGVELEVPEGIRFVIEERLAQLGASTREALLGASLLGRDFGFDLLQELSALGDDELLDAVEEAERAHLIASSVENHDVRFSFQHELIRKTLMHQLSHTRLQRLHLRVADALEAVHPAALAPHAAAICFHLERSGPLATPDRRIRFLTLAADRALEAVAFEEAVEHLEALLDLIPPTDLATRGTLHEKLATAQRSLGHLTTALAHWDEALDAFDEAGAPAEVARVSLDAAMQVAWWRRGGNVERLLSRGFEAAGGAPSPTRAGLLAVAGMTASQNGRYGEGNELLTEALAMARQEHHDRMIGLTLYGFSAHCFAYQRFQEAIELGLESQDSLRRASDLWNLANVLGYIGASYGWVGRFDEAATIGTEGEALALRLGNWPAYVFSEQARSFSDIGHHPSHEALTRRGERALELGEEMGFAWLCSLGHGRLGLASFWSGSWHDALRHFEDAARSEPRGASGGHLGRFLSLHAYLGNRAETQELLERARPDFAVAGRPSSLTSWALVASAVEAMVMLGDREGAAALYDTLTALSTTGVVLRTWDFRLVATLRGMAAGAGGDWDRAEGHFEDARRLARALPMLHEEPEAERFHAQMLLTRDRAGDRARAKEMLERAATAYDGFHMAGHAALARSLAR